jgi:hypothetical protein
MTRIFCAEFDLAAWIETRTQAGFRRRSGSVHDLTLRECASATHDLTVGLSASYVKVRGDACALLPVNRTMTAYGWEGLVEEVGTIGRRELFAFYTDLLQGSLQRQFAFAVGCSPRRTAVDLSGPPCPHSAYAPSSPRAED